MKIFKDFILKASAYTVLTLSLFYIYGGISSLNENGIHWTRFLIIAGYSCLIAGVELLNSCLTIKHIFKVIVHYSILLIGFIIIFFTAGTSSFKPSTLFIAVILFTVIYLAVSLIVLGIGKLNKNSKDDEPEKKNNCDKPKKKEYRSLYGDN